MWKRKSTIIFPPCNVKRLLEETDVVRKTNVILSVGQFRPEKNHSLQLRAFARAKCKLPAGMQLIMAGGIRNKEDESRVEVLMDEAKSLNLVIGKDIVFMISKPYEDIVNALKQATIAIHTMADEHFGIVVVEYMAAGAVPVVHDSGGPKMDIVTSNMLGRRASSEDEFVENIVELITTSESNLETMRVAGKEHVRSKFSDETFIEAFSSMV